MSILKLHSEPVQDSWLDYYGHMNEGYYVVAFSNATWPLQRHFGIDEDTYFKETGCAMYTVESHVRYVDEVKGGSQLDFESMVLGYDAKKLHIAHVMKVDGTERATFECLLLHFDTKEGRTVAMPDKTLTMLGNALMDEVPDWSGRSVSIAKK